MLPLLLSLPLLEQKTQNYSLLPRTIELPPVPNPVGVSKPIHSLRPVGFADNRKSKENQESDYKEYLWSVVSAKKSKVIRLGEQIQQHILESRLLSVSSI